MYLEDPGVKGQLRIWMMNYGTKSRWAVFFVFFAYLILVNSLPVTITMWQGYDDALFIRLGRSIADGQWLGPYNELTLMKGPIYPIFLALVSCIGLSFATAQFVLHFIASLYFSHTVSRLFQQKGLAFWSTFIVLLLCPAIYTASGAVIREFFYADLGLILFALGCRAFLQSFARRSDFAFAALAGGVFGAYWLTREEGIAIVPSISVLILGSILARNFSSTELKLLVTKACLFLASTIVFVSIIGFINQRYYGRFETIEMKSSEFQNAMEALQRVGAPYELPFLPVPRAARDDIYRESPSFARLKEYLDPTGGKNPFTVACTSVAISTCGDLPGGFFMWALRDAASRAAIYQSSTSAADFYRTLTAEIRTACDEGRLRCTRWLTPFLPSMTPEQWRAVPSGVWKGLQLLIYIPDPDFARPASSLDAPDALQSLNFLNVNYGSIKLSDQPLPPTLVKQWINSFSLRLFAHLTIWYRFVILGGMAAFLLLVVTAPSSLRTPSALFTSALFLAALVRVVILALIESSSFGALYYSRVAPAAPLMVAASILSFYLLRSARASKKNR